jgi:nucleoside-diphosphate-sugar epimerase
MKRLLIAGYGDIARRAAPSLETRFVVSRLARAEGADLDRPGTLDFAPAEALLHLAPPTPEGEHDLRTATLLAALEKTGILPARVVYVSTSGVYGDCGGARVDESRAPAPATARALRRVDAERRLAHWCAAHGAALVILRAPGIYARDRLPLERLRARLPVLRADEDIYTNHIHADDLAAIAVRALEDGAPEGIYNASDDSEVKMGDWMDCVADYAALPRPPRVSREAARAALTPISYSFMSESRRLDNTRLKRRLGFALRYPTIEQGLAHAPARAH